MLPRLIESLDERNQGFVSVVVLVELHRVLRLAYKVSREDAAVIVRTLLDSQELSVQESDTVRRSLARLADAVSPPRPAARR